MFATIRASVVYPDFVGLYGSPARHAVPDHALARFLCLQVFQHLNNPPRPQAGDADAETLVSVIYWDDRVRLRRAAAVAGISQTPNQELRDVTKAMTIAT